jgi:hypothetical protein
MKVKNITNRIIAVGSIFIEPGCDANVDDSFSQSLNKDYFEFLDEEEKINEKEENPNPKRIGLNQKNKDLNKNTESEDDKP